MLPMVGKPLALVSERMTVVGHDRWRWPGRLRAGLMLLCGLIAASYPFFGVTCYCVCVMYPNMLQGGLANVDDERPIARLKTLAWRYLVVAMLVPMLGVVALVAMDLDARLALGILSTGALIGSGFVFRIYQRLQGDLDSLGEALKPR